MKRSVLVMRAAVVGAALAAGAAANSQTPSEHATGAIAVDPAEYAKFPKVQRHRAWIEPKVDLSDRFPPVGDQEWQSSCVAWATGYGARSFMEGTQIGRPPRAASELVSPAYIFYRVRDKKEACVGSGSNVAAALDLLTKEGAVSLAEMPYGTMTCHNAPTAQQISSATRFKIGGWRAIQRETPGDIRTPVVLDDVKAQLMAERPVVFTMPVPKTWDKWKGTEVYNTTETGGGMHAMVLVGYDESKQAFRLLNSWGPLWGDKGYAWIGYQTFARLAQEAYVMEPPEKAQPAPPAGPPQSVDQQLTKLAGGLQCGTARFRATPTGRVIEGFSGVGQNYNAARDKALALDPKLKWDVAYHPWPQCESELTLANPLAGSGTRIAVRKLDGPALPADAATLKAGDLFAVDVASTPDKPFVEVIYLQADGSAVELYRGLAKPGPGGAPAVTLGASGKKEARFQVDGPYGDEILIAIASNKPVFGDELAGHHTERQFLTLLRTRLTEATRAGQPVSAAVQRLRTVG